MLGELSGLWPGEGDVRVEGRELPTPSLMACRAFRELLENVVVLPPLPPPLPMPLIGECRPKTESTLIKSTVLLFPSKRSSQPNNNDPNCLDTDRLTSR